MFTVDLYLKVRRAHFQDGLSECQIALDFGISRDSVAKMLAYSEPLGYRRMAPPLRRTRKIARGAMWRRIIDGAQGPFSKPDHD